MTNNIKLSRINVLFVVTYFLIAPIYHQPIIPNALWVAAKLVLLSVVVLVAVVGVCRAGHFSFGFDDAAFLSAIVISALFSYDGVGPLFSLFVGYLFYLLGKSQHYLLGGEDFMKNIVSCFQLSGLYVIFVAVLVLMGGELDVITGGLNSNSFSLYLATVGAVLFFSYGQHRKVRDVVVLASIGFLVLYGGSRGGLLLFVGMFLSCLLYARGWISVSLLIVFAVLSLLVMLDPAQLQDFRVYQQYQRYSQGDDFDVSSGRFDGFLFAIDMFSESMLTGVGEVDLTNFGFGYSQIHNFYLRMLVEGGLLLFGPLVCLLAIVGVKLWMSAYPSRILVLNCLLLLFLPLMYEPNGLFGNFMIAGILWFLVGYLASYPKSLRPSGYQVRGGIG